MSLLFFIYVNFYCSITVELVGYSLVIKYLKNYMFKVTSYYYNFS